MRFEGEWHDARHVLPGDGRAVAATVAGRYPPSGDDTDSLAGKHFWLVMPMHFRHLHPVEDSAEVITNCFVDSDHVVRMPRGGGTEEVVTHWTELPPLPGTTDRWFLAGDEAQAAIERT